MVQHFVVNRFNQSIPDVNPDLFLCGQCQIHLRGQMSVVRYQGSSTIKHVATRSEGIALSSWPEQSGLYLSYSIYASQLNNCKTLQDYWQSRVCHKHICLPRLVKVDNNNHNTIKEIAVDG